MGKMTASLLLVFFIEVGLYFFAGTNYTKTALYAILIDPTSLLSSAFWSVIIVIAGATALLAVITPGFLYQVNQWALFASAVAILITYVASIAQLWSFLYNALTIPSMNLAIQSYAGLIASIITAPLIIFYLTAMLEWTRFN